MENQEQAQAPAQPELSLADLQNLRVIIEMAVRRGAFGANEMSSVGAVFDRLNNFLTAVAPQQQSAQSEESARNEEPAQAE